MKTAASLVALSGLWTSLHVQARPLHANINYTRYLQQKSNVTDELSAWMARFGTTGDAYGWIPATEARSAEQVQEDRQQRFFMAKELVEKMNKEHPGATFSTDSPFTLLTEDEFAKYVQNSKLSDAPQSRHLMAENNRVGWAHGNFHNLPPQPAMWPNNHQPFPNPHQPFPPQPVSPHQFPVPRPFPPNQFPPNQFPVPQPFPPNQFPVPQPFPVPVSQTPSIEPAKPSGPVAPDHVPVAPNKTLLFPKNDMKVDWSRHQCIAPIQHQGGCGSCWAFATLSVIESGECIARKANHVTKYSENNLSTCDKKNQGCIGGMPHDAMTFIQSHGACNALDDPYTGGKGVLGECSNCKRVKTGFKSYQFVYRDADLVQAIERHPVVIGLHASNNAWKQYKRGVLTASDCGQGKLDHSVVAVGYNDKSFKLRNSWGAEWGMDGYMYIERSRTGPGVCGMYQYMLEATF